MVEQTKMDIVWTEGDLYSTEDQVLGSNRMEILFSEWNSMQIFCFEFGNDDQFLTITIRSLAVTSTMWWFSWSQEHQQ